MKVFLKGKKIFAMLTLIAFLCPSAALATSRVDYDTNNPRSYMNGQERDKSGNSNYDFYLLGKGVRDKDSKESKNDRYKPVNDNKGDKNNDRNGKDSKGRINPGNNDRDKKDNNNNNFDWNFNNRDRKDTNKDAKDKKDKGKEDKGKINIGDKNKPNKENKDQVQISV